MYLPKKQKRIFFSVIFTLLLIAISTPSIKRYLPDELQNVLFVSDTTPTPETQGSTTTQSGKTFQSVKVIRIVDGDTIVIEGGEKLRYIGMNTPESVDPRKPVQCFAEEATQRNKELVEGKTIRLEKDVSETDRSGRLLRYVYADDKMVNEELVREGFAFASAYPPDIKYQERLSAAESEARENKRGLWSKCEADN